MNILNYCNGADTGGVSNLLRLAHAKYSAHTYTSLVRSSNYIHYPRQLGPSSHANAIKAADVIHANNNFRLLERVDKPMVIHYHGTPFRLDPEPYLAEQHARGAVGVVATLDLLAPAPDELTWVPAPADMEWLGGFRKVIGDGRIRIGHAPTDRAIKSTEALIRAVKRLAKSHPVELVLIERQPWRACLQQKGSVDLYFDQVILGYGMNAIEAWGMGIPVVCGAQPDTLAVMRDRFGELPFVAATEETIYEALSSLMDEGARAEWSGRGRAHVERFHAEKEVVRVLEPIYQQAFTADRPPLPPPPPPPARRGPARRHRR